MFALPELKLFAFILQTKNTRNGLAINLQTHTHMHCFDPNLVALNSYIYYHQQLIKQFNDSQISAIGILFQFCIDHTIGVVWVFFLPTRESYIVAIPLNMCVGLLIAA